MEEIVALCKRRGFVFPSSEIYGGLGSTYDYGHYGVLLKTNVKSRVVAVDAAGARRHRRARLGDPPAPARSGRPPATSQGFTDPLVQCLGKCKRRWREDHLREAVEAEGGDPDAELQLPRVRRRALRAAPVQPDVRDPRRPGRRRGLRGLPAPGDGAGHLHQLQERARLRPQEAAVRDRPGRQVLPQRDHPRQLHLPHPRVRADGDGVLRPARPRPSSWYRDWIEERERWYTDLGLRPDHLRVRAHDADELSHYSSGTSDVEYLFPIGWSELEGIANRGDFDLNPARQVQRREARVLRPADQRALRPARDRARRRRRPRDARLPRRLLRGRGGRGPPAHRAAPAPAPGPGQGRRPAARLQGGHAGEGARDLRRTCAAGSPPSSTRAARSASATAARTRSAPPGASPSTTRRWRTTPSPCATATRSSRSGSRSRASATSWSRASKQPWRSPKLATEPRRRHARVQASRPIGRSRFATSSQPIDERRRDGLRDEDPRHRAAR